MTTALTPLFFVLQLTAAPTLTVEVASIGSASDPLGPSWFGLVQDELHEFVVETEAGAPVVFLASAGAPSGLRFEGQPLLVDPATAFVVGAATADSSGEARVGVLVPSTLTVGTPLWTQAAVVDPTGFATELTNGLEHAATDLSFAVLAEGDKTAHPAGWAPPNTLLIEDAPAWQAFWFEHHPFLPAPSVDFARDVVLASFGGLVGQTGYSLTVDDLTPIGGGLRVESTLNTPGPGCGGLYSMRNPFQFVAVDRAAAANLVTQMGQAQGPACP